MKYLLFIVALFALNSVFVSAKEPTLQQKQALFMLNYAQYSAYKLKTYNNILALEDEYKTLKDNMNLELIEDRESVAEITNLMAAITNERINNKNRERIEASIKRRMNQAIYNSFPTSRSIVAAGGNWKTLGIQSLYGVGSLFMSYKQYKNQLSEEYDSAMWEIEKNTILSLNAVASNLLLYSFDLIHKYNISDEWRLTETELTKMFDILKDENQQRMYQNLQYLENDRFFQHFPMYWYHLAKTAQENKDENNAIKYYKRYELENIPIFRYDTIAVDAYKGEILLLLKRKQFSKIKEKLIFIEKNKTSWTDYYFCAMTYYRLGDIDNAKRLLERNINELSSSVENKYLEISSLTQINEIKTKFDNSEFDGLELSKALSKTMSDNEEISLKAIEEHYNGGFSSYKEKLYWFGNNTTNTIVADSIKYVEKVLLSAIAISNSEAKVVCQLPMKWVLSSNVNLFAVFINPKENKEEKVLLNFDEKAVKKIKNKTIENCSLIYSNKIKIDWKNGWDLLGIRIEHPLYPIDFIYDINLNKGGKKILPVKIRFNNNEYKLEDFKEK